MPKFQPIPLFGTGVESISPNITSQRRVNMYYDVRQDKDKNELVLIQSPGLTLFVQLPTSPIRGMLTDGLYAYVVAGNVLYLISPQGAWCELGTLNTSANLPVTMSFGETQIIIVDGFFGYVLQNIPTLVNLAQCNGIVPETITELQFLYDVQAANEP